MRGVAFSILLLTCVVGASSIAAGQGYAPVDCPAFIQRQAAERDAAVACGHLAVPEDRDSPASASLQLFVARVASRLPNDSAPIVYLPGGPGVAAHALLEDWLESAIHQHYDIILVDQRGSGLSTPTLNCHERDSLQAQDWLRVCRDRLLREGRALHAYHSAASARDIHDLLIALDIAEANVVGASYGSRLALTLARDFPGRVRSLILDGVVPLQAKALDSLAVNGHRALERLFADCAGDPACNRAYPNLGDAFYETLRQLNRAPARIDGPVPLVITGRHFALDLYFQLYRRHAISFAPAWIDAHARGDYAYEPAIDRAVEPDSETRDRPDALSEGLRYSVECAEEVPFNSRGEILNRAAGIPSSLRRALTTLALDLLDDCAEWRVPPRPASENLPARSDIPALLLSGRYDPATPPQWGEEAAKHLANSWHVVIPDGGHGALFDEPCAQAIALAFLRAPPRQPEAACLERLKPPAFAVHAES